MTIFSILFSVGLAVSAPQAQAEAPKGILTPSIAGNEIGGFVALVPLTPAVMKEGVMAEGQPFVTQQMTLARYGTLEKDVILTRWALSSSKIVLKAGTQVYANAIMNGTLQWCVLTDKTWGMVCLHTEDGAWIAEEDRGWPVGDRQWKTANLIIDERPFEGKYTASWMLVHHAGKAFIERKVTYESPRPMPFAQAFDFPLDVLKSSDMQVMDGHKGVLVHLDDATGVITSQLIDDTNSAGK